jgi:UDP-glucuronate decarboxylase
MDPLDGRVVSNFINQCLCDKDITIYGDGSQTRSFCYVDDMVEGLIALMNTPNITGPINLGNPDERTIINLVDKITSLVPGTKSKVVFRDLPCDDPIRRRPDITKAQQLLNWTPCINIDQGLQMTIDYFIKNLK